ncbi:leucine-rich repeat-containing protein 15-like [Corticium candelabrum]|uniref:leucine-rich repeat-containing protein 15-like n=1 Tax=Corticium candelabrum TaxID=121492 RepID=UPI002E2539AC|nr:leucine-rich repeat-containing protein 15-like [Corticium candelabrum]
MHSLKNGNELSRGKGYGVGSAGACSFNCQEEETQETKYLQYTDINSVPSGAFSGLSSLTILNLSANALSSLPVDAFDGLSSLQHLSLGRNSLSQFPNMGPFEASLTALDLRFNSLTEITSNILNDMTNLQLLHLEGNQISAISVDSFVGLTNLLTLQLNSNLLRTVPSALDSVSSSLQYLCVTVIGFRELIEDLSNNNFSSFPSDNFGTAPLTRLFVSKNRLQHLPPSLFQNLTLLEHFYLNNNKLVKVDSRSLNASKQLQKIVLQYNELPELDSSTFRDFSNLQELYVVAYCCLDF